MYDFLHKLFDSDGFIPRRVCGLWPDWLVWEHVVGNALIWLAYMAMPAMIWRLGRRKPEWSSSSGLLRVFCYFIGLCGLGHFLDMMAFYRPMYRLSGVVLIATGLASWWTAWTLRRAWPGLMAMKSPAELEQVIEEQTRALRRTIDDLERSETARAYLAKIIEFSDDAVVSKNLDGVITSWNIGAERLFGYTAAEALGRSIAFLIPPEYEHEEASILEQLRAGIRMDHFESIRLAKDGRRIDVSLTISPIKDHSGRIVGISNIARDITDKKANEAQIRLLYEDLERRVEVRTAELSQQSRLIDQAHDAILVRSREGVISSWNQGAERLYGWAKEEALGRVSHELLESQFPGPLAEIEEDLTRLGSWEGELIHKRRDGIQVVVASRWIVDRDRSSHEAVLEINSDITDRRASEEALRRSEAALRESQRLAGVGSWEWDPVADIVTWSDELYRIAGRDRSLPPPRYVEHDRLYTPESLALLGPMVMRALESGEPYEIELEMMAGDGIHRWIIARGEAIRDSSGRVVKLRGTGQDVTERREGREELRRALDRAVAATEAKGDFLANMSHEIRTPMNGVIGMAELLLDTDLNDLQRRYAETISGSGEALLTLINDILDFSKIEAGKLTLDVVEFDLRQLMEEVADLLAPRAYQKRLELTCRVAPGVPARLLGDPMRVRQVLTNLAGNALKFTDQGEVNVEAEILGGDETGLTLKILVRDTGIGIAEDRQADVFDAFSQVDSGSNRKYGGTGLGLGICRRLVNLMGGKIGLESVPGRGSTFWFELTLGKAAGEPDSSDVRLDGLRVLVVEDHETNGIILRETLESWGCRPEVTASGAEAIARLFAPPDGVPYQVILLDDDMPGLDGRQTARAIKDIPRFANLPLILLHSPGSTRRDDAAEGGLFVESLTKPIRRSHLYDALRRAITASASSRDRPPTAIAGNAKLATSLRILLAEDNEVNRRVATGLVERLGCHVDAVVNGREAVERFDVDRHDLILMDVQMPEMDGFAATAAIRERQRGTERRVPIIALTAHAMLGDRERCLAAGMDDYLAKPVRPGPLREMLLAWSIKPRSPTDEQPEGDREDEGRSFSHEALRDSCGDDPALIGEVLALILRGAPDRLECLERAIVAEDGPAIVREAHGLKGSFLTVGAEALARTCRELMRLGEDADLAAIRAVHRAIRPQWARFEGEASRHLETLSMSS